jgi:hypothetical protein
VEGESVLQMVAEASVAFAGFTGVVAVLGSRSSGGWRPVDVIRFRAMVASSLLMLGFAILPILLHYLGLSPRAYWATSSAFLGCVLPLWLWRTIALQQKHRVEQDPDFLPGVRVVTLAVIGLATVAQFMNALDVWIHRSFGGYLVGLFALLFASSMMFVLLLRFVRFENAEL